jgi:DNA-binding IclR family transcriptional regulator
LTIPIATVIINNIIPLNGIAIPLNGKRGELMIGKAFKILESMVGNQESNTIIALSQRTGLPKSTVHRILVILAEEEVVTSFPGKGYVLTPKLLSLGLKGLGQKKLLDVAIPVMRTISEKTKETVSLNIICGTERICVYKVEGEHLLPGNIRIGDHGHLLKGAAGKVIAAGLSSSELKRIIDKYMATGVIPVGQVSEILTEMEQIRVKGFATSIEERFVGCASIAIPLLDITGQTMASLSISTVPEKIKSKEMEDLVQVLVSSASEIFYASV